MASTLTRRPSTLKAMRADLAAIAAEQARHGATLAAILALLERGRGASSLSREDRALLSRLLPPIGGVFGSAPFLARDLFESEAAALRVVLRGLTSKRVGRLFERAEGQPVDGYVVQRAGEELHTVLWQVMRVPGERNPVVPPIPADAQA